MKRDAVKNAAREILTASLVVTIVAGLTATTALTLSCGPDQAPRTQDIRPDTKSRGTQENNSEEIKSKIQESLSIRQKAREAEQTAVARGKEITPTPPEPTPTDDMTEPPTKTPTKAPTVTPQIIPTEIPTDTPTNIPTPAQTEISTEVPTATPTETPVGPTTSPDPDQTPISEPTTFPTTTALSRVYKLPWVKDGTTNQERETLGYLTELARYNPDLTQRLLNMPFLQTHEPTDTGAAGALNYLDYNRPEDAEEVVDHFENRNGIIDEDTVRVALAYTQALLGGSMTETLLNQNLETLSRTAQLPRGGEVQITLVKEETKPSEETLDRIEDALIKLEKYFQVSVPTHNIIVHYGGTLPPGARSGNTFISITQETGQDEVDQFHWTVHELVHYWFNSNESWLDEGMAQAVTSIIQAGFQSGERPQALPTTSRNCPESARIETTLNQLQETNAVGSRCVYALGERFMQVLYEEAGYEGFREGTGALAKIGTTSPRRQMGIEQVKRAFQNHPDAVREATKRWHQDSD